MPINAGHSESCHDRMFVHNFESIARAFAKVLRTFPVSWVVTIFLFGYLWFFLTVDEHSKKDTMTPPSIKEHDTDYWDARRMFEAMYISIKFSKYYTINKLFYHLIDDVQEPDLIPKVKEPPRTDDPSIYLPIPGNKT